MMTVLETTVWDMAFQPNHKYIVSDDMRTVYAYIKQGDKYPYIYNNPQSFNTRYRTFKVLSKTKDLDSSKQWNIQGSKGNKYRVTLLDGKFSCTCPAATFRGGDCKHIQQVKENQ